MNYFEGVINDVNTADFDLIKKNLEPLQEANQTIANYIARINKVVKDYQKTGTIADVSYLANWEDAKDDHKKSAGKKSNERNSAKENIEPTETPPLQVKQESPIKTRPRRNAFKEATENINQQVNASLTTKLRRPTDVTDNVSVKLEKLSTCDSEKSVTDSSQVQDVKVKGEMEDMPAPTRRAPRRKKRNGESKIQVKEEKIEEIKNKIRDSDVIIEDMTLPVINLIDTSDDGEKTVVGEENLKGKSTKKEAKTMKRARTSSEDKIKGRGEKRTKSNEQENENETIRANLEGATSTLEIKNDVNNLTFITKPPNNGESQQNLNTTVVVQNPKYASSLIPQSVNDMMTDDESDEEIPKKNARKPVGSIPKPVKQIFSPFDQSPVKKKVQAFEKLREEANAIPPRITRTKTRAQAKEQAAADDVEPTDEQKSNVKEKAKIFTPTASKFMPTAASTTLKSKRVASSSNESLVSAKSASALKASQAEYREREKKRREREEEAKKKREALLQAHIEEKKRKREEKQLKAQQQREAQEQQKLKALEVQKLKDERHKQLLAEQEEKKLKQKEEMEKKRLMAKKRALEEKKKEEEKRIEEQKKTEEMTAKLAKQDKEMARMLQQQKQKKVPIYMRVRAPQLPTPDCYDSDDDEYRSQDLVLPDWVKERNLKFMQRCASAAGEAIKNTFFSVQAQTPDLQDIFEVIEPQKLKRSSSAVWHKPPRFTMLPPSLADHDEGDDFTDE